MLDWRIYLTQKRFSSVSTFLSLSTVIQLDSEQMFERERLYLLLLFNLDPGAVTECTLGLQAAKNDGGCV